MSPLIEALILIVAGAIALLLGKQLFWLFAGIVGFALGWWLTGLVIANPLLHLLVGVVVGIILAALTRWMGKWAIRIVAAIAGFFILPSILGGLGMLGGIGELVWAVIGAAIGFVFALFMADWALIILSSIIGAELIMRGASIVFESIGGPISPPVRLIGLIVLVVIGMVFQSRQRR